jgi:hypothetical protein
MPNHITNELTLIGEQSKIDELLSKVKGDNIDFDFNTFAPMPEELKGTMSPAKIVTQKEYDEWLESKLKKKDNWIGSPITQEKNDRLIANYGFNNWYDWSIANWGTKWNAYSVSVVDNNIYFETAWSTPFHAMIRLSQAFPDVTLSMRFADEDFGSNVGEYELKNGELIGEYVPDYGEDSIRLAVDISGGDYFYSDYLVDLDDNRDDVLVNTCIKLNHEKGYPFDDFPKFVLEKLLEYATKDEQFERASKIKKQLDDEQNR